MPSPTDPNMGLFLPTAAVTPGPQWATELTTNMSTVGAHDHTAGKGVSIPIAAVTVSADFSWLNFGQTNIGYASFIDKLLTSNLTVNASLGNVLGQPYWRDSSGVVKKFNLAGDPVSIPSGSAASGSILFTAIGAPGTPAAGTAIFWVDATSKNHASKDDAGNVNHGVRTIGAVASNWLTAIADNGVASASQPAFTDISGSLVTAQITALAVTNAKLNSAGTSAGRLWVPELVGAIQSPSAAASLTGPTWTAGKYREIMVVVDGDDTSLNTSFGCQITLVGLTAGSEIGVGLSLAGTTSSGQSSGAGKYILVSGSTGTSHVLARATLYPLTTGRTRRYLSHAVVSNASVGTSCDWVGGGEFPDTTHDVTGVNFTFGSFTGTVAVWGLLA